MYIFKPPQKDMFWCNPPNIARLAINEHRPSNQPGINVQPIYPFEINTGFICSWKAIKFYERWFTRLSKLSEEIDLNDISYSIMEERVCDIMFFDEGVDFEFFNAFQVNEDVSNYTNDEIENLCFFHGHIGMEKNWKPFLESYLRRI